MPIFTPGQTVLLKCPHGLGDVVQFTICLQHLKEVYPNVAFDVLVGAGKASLIPDDLCRHAIDDKALVDEAAYDVVHHSPMWDAGRTFAEFPSTKPYRTLIDDFGISPTSRRYRVRITDHDREIVDAYTLSLPDKPFALIHYEGNSFTRNKNLSHETANRAIQRFKAAGLTPVVLDFDAKSPHIDNVNVFCPDRSNPLWAPKHRPESSTIAALIERASLFVGIDSCPEHLCGALETPLILCWVRHHPLHYFDWAPNVEHLVPRKDHRMIRGDRKIGLAYFKGHYRHRYYDDLDRTLCKALDDHLMPRRTMAIPSCQCEAAGTCPLFQRITSDIEHVRCKSTDEHGLRHRQRWAKEIGLF